MSKRSGGDGEGREPGEAKRGSRGQQPGHVVGDPAPHEEPFDGTRSGRLEPLLDRSPHPVQAGPAHVQGDPRPASLAPEEVSFDRGGVGLVQHPQRQPPA